MMFKNRLPSLLFTILIACFSMGAFAQSKDVPPELYKASTIPDSLKVDAHSVVRYALESDVVKGPGKEIQSVHTVTTLLDEKAEGLAAAALPYNKKFGSINSFEMIVYDANGNQVKKYHKGDMYDHAAFDDETLVSDDRVMQVRHVVASYPVTIELIYETTATSLINLGEWVLQEPEQSVQNSGLMVQVNANSGFRYLNKNTGIKAEKTTADGIDTYSWQANGLKAIKPEEGAVSWKLKPSVRFAENAFEFYGIPGDLSTWAGYGKWQQVLNADVCSLSPAREEEIKKMTSDIKTDKEKVKFLYQYLQANTRYVNIQLGIGGLKPLPATFVDQKKYGDCKALSNYMTALLKAVDIPSCYAIVRAGTNEEPADLTFPYDNFNHVIVCVPLKGDTTWLECTDSKQPFGKLGTFTENRNALLITPEGGKLVNTPKSTDTDNQFNSETHITLLADGGAKATAKILATGAYRDEYDAILGQSSADQKTHLINTLEIKQPLGMDIKPVDDKDGVKQFELSLEYDRYCDIAAGSKLFYHAALFNVWTMTVPQEDKRKASYYFEHPRIKTCVTTIDLPEGYEIESMPANANLKFTYGTFDLTYTYDATKNQLTCKAKFNLTNNVIPAARYAEMQHFMDDVAKAQNKKLVIKKKA